MFVSFSFKHKKKCEKHSLLLHISQPLRQNLVIWGDFTFFLFHVSGYVYRFHVEYKWLYASYTSTYFVYILNIYKAIIDCRSSSPSSSSCCIQSLLLFHVVQSKKKKDEILFKKSFKTYLSLSPCGYHLYNLMSL